VGVLAIVGVAVYFGTRKPRRKNPTRRANPCGSCAAANPAPMEWIDTTGEDVTDAAPRRRNPRRSSKRRPGRSKGKLPRRRNEYSGTFGFPSVQPDVMQLQAPVMMPILGNPKRTLAAELEKFARETAADMGGTYQDAVSAMREEPGEVAANLRAAGYRVTTAAVIRWTETPKKANPRRRRNPLGLAPGETGPRVVYLADGGPIVGWELWSTRSDGAGKAYHGSYRTVRDAQGWALANLNVARFETTQRLTGTGLREGGGRKRRNPKARSAGKRAR
jgi:hypothetical protein